MQTTIHIEFSEAARFDAFEIGREIVTCLGSNTHSLVIFIPNTTTKPMMGIHRRDKYLAQKWYFPTLSEIPCVCKMYLIFFYFYSSRW